MATQNTHEPLESGTFKAAKCGEFPNDNPELHLGTVSYDYADEDADLAREPIEVVDELSFDDAVDEAPLGGDLEDDLPAIDAPFAEEPPDAFTAFAQVLAQVAKSFGADSEATTHLRALLGQVRAEGIAADSRALAWQGILRGQSEDFGPCGAETLDEWAASIVGRVVPSGGRSEAIRRELRSHGVAAFGFIAAAA